MIVYIVFSGEYSDRGVARVFANEDIAKAYMYECRKRDPDETFDIEVYELSDDQVILPESSIEAAKEEIKMGYFFSLYHDGSIKWVSSYEIIERDDRYLQGCLFPTGFSVAVIAKDPSEKERDRCLKVARDAMAKAKAEMGDCNGRIKGE